MIIIPTYPSYKGNEFGQNDPVYNTGVSLIGSPSLFTVKAGIFAAESILFGIGIKAAESRLLANAAANQNIEAETLGFNIAQDPNRYNPDEPEMISFSNGLPVMSTFGVIGGTYTDTKGNLQNIPDILLQTVIISAVMNKNIVETQVAGRNGKVKESISLDDWNIEIRAVITKDAPVNVEIEKGNPNGAYPTGNMSYINQMINAPISLPINCWYLNQLGINYIVVKSATISQIEGEYSMQRLVISAVSDSPLVINIGS